MQRMAWARELLAAACMQEGVVPPSDTMEALTWCRRPVADWPIAFAGPLVRPGQRLDRPLLLGDEPSDLCRELALAQRDAEMEIQERYMREALAQAERIPYTSAGSLRRPPNHLTGPVRSARRRGCAGSLGLSVVIVAATIHLKVRGWDVARTRAIWPGCRTVTANNPTVALKEGEASRVDQAIRYSPGQHDNTFVLLTTVLPQLYDRRVFSKPT
jgi:hypothetical protein